MNRYNTRVSYWWLIDPGVTMRSLRVVVPVTGEWSLALCQRSCPLQSTATRRAHLTAIKPELRSVTLHRLSMCNKVDISPWEPHTTFTHSIQTDQSLDSAMQAKYISVVQHAGQIVGFALSGWNSREMVYCGYEGIDMVRNKAQIGCGI